MENGHCVWAVFLFTTQDLNMIGIAGGVMSIFLVKGLFLLYRRLNSSTSEGGK